MTAVEFVRTEMAKVAVRVGELGIVIPSLDKELLFPIAAYSFLRSKGKSPPNDPFWLGCLALQMVQETTIHCTETRWELPQNTNESVHQCPHLTSAFRVATMMGMSEFLTEFIETVHARMHPPRETANDCLATYEKLAREKNGAVWGLSTSLSGWTDQGVSTLEIMREIGVEIGFLHQMVEDFLDYCPQENTQVPTLQTFHQRIWTFILGSQGMEWFDQLPQEAIDTFFHQNNGPSMAEQALSQIIEHSSALLIQIQNAGAQAPIIKIIQGWIDRCTHAFQKNNQTHIAHQPAFPLPRKLSQAIMGAQIALRAQHLDDVSYWRKFFSANSRSFSFSARLFPPEERSLIIGIYAFCRFTDNLVDKDCGRIAQAYQTLDLWDEITQAAYHGYATGIPVADVVMHKMAQMKIPFSLVSELIEGMRMDVEPYTYRSMEDLRRYTYRVASVVGAWITYAFGIRDPWVLQRAHDLGHAMQLTNIIRDVGEDLAMGRIYLPADLMQSKNISTEMLKKLKAQAPRIGRMPAGYIALLEEIMGEADAAYQRAYEGIPFLPPRLRRPIAVAAQVYQGIHHEVRENGCNNLTRRAYTSLWKKFALARKGLHQLKRTSENQNP